MLSKANLKPTHRNFFQSLSVWILSIIGLFVALNILGLKSLAASLLAGGGITAVVLGFAFRDIGENFLAGFFLAFSRPFLMEKTRKGSHSRHATEYRSRFWVHESRYPVRYFINIGPNDQKLSAPMQAKVADKSTFRILLPSLTKKLQLFSRDLGSI